MKIQTIKVQNFKAVAGQQLNLNGASAIVTAGNRQGKTSVLRGLIDRFRSEKPDQIVKEGEKKGFNHIELSDGSRIEWNFTEKSESFAYITPDGIKMTQGVIKEIGERYFGKSFDIDKFILSGAKEQVKQMQLLCGLDFTDIDKRYKEAFEGRTEKNRELKRIAAMKLEKPDQVEKPDVEGIEKELADARKYNEEQMEIDARLRYQENTFDSILELIEGTKFEKFFDEKGARQFLKEYPHPEKQIDIAQLEQKYRDANAQLRQYDAYERDLQAYENWVKGGKQARDEANKADELVKAIEQEKKDMIAQASLPEGFDIVDDNLHYNGYPLSNSNQSSSEKYIAALKLGAMATGKIRTLHFDASTLDRNSLSEVQKWAESEDLQLLIERPDFDGGEIRYEII